MKIPTPHDIGLPEQFDSWRDNQRAALELMLTDTKRVTGLVLPTGSGKTLCAVAFALLTKKPTCYVTNNRGLQDQAMELFGECGMVDLRGRSNYPCSLQPGLTCLEGYAASCPYKGTIACPSSQAEMRAATSPLVITNYAKWTAAKKFGQGMAHFQQVIFDEAHECPGALADAMQVVLHRREIEETLGCPFPTHKDLGEMQNWKVWAAEARAEAEGMMVGARNQVRGTAAPKPAWIRHFTHMQHLVRRLAILSSARAADWVVDETKEGYQFDPIRPGRYAESALLMRMPRIICMSGTLRPKTLFMMGISKDTMSFTEYLSDFDPARCPIYYVPTMRVDKNAHDLSMLWIRLDQLVAKRQDRKGIVHTISYARRDEIMGASRFSSRMLINPKGEPTSEMVEQFKQSPAGTIFVSPSVGAGYDFPGSTCEYQFICKIPFPDGRAKVLKARQVDDPEYGPYLAMQGLVQACGRGMRGKDDQCETVVPDDHLDWFLPRYAHLAPKSFHRFFRRVSVLPQPPPPLG